MNTLLPIVKWYENHKRDLPWRNTKSPYLIWLSEVIMQQTRVDQGLPYYIQFSQQYPTLQSLAKADDQDVMKLWQGLGYYNRAKNMLKTARFILENHGGQFPKSHDGLIELPGIGPYTAAAIASFAYNEPKAVVDGNVYRVLSRVFNIDLSIDSSAGKQYFSELAQVLLDKKNPATYNQAIMELGAIICKPNNPLCQECDLQTKCLAYSEKTIALRPVKKVKQKSKERFLHYFVLLHKGKIFIQQRTHERIWHNLFEPPYIETSKAVNQKELKKVLLKNPLFNQIELTQDVFTYKHLLTHQTIYGHFWIVTNKLNTRILKKDYIAVSLNDIHQYPIHRLFDKFLEHFIPNYKNQ